MVDRAGWLRLVVSTALVLGAMLGLAPAQDFPSRPVTLIVPYAAGGTTDVGLRALATATERHLGQSILVENRPGVGGVLGPMQMASGSKPDGYTISQIPITVFRYPYTTKTSFDPLADLTISTPRTIARSSSGRLPSRRN